MRLKPRLSRRCTLGGLPAALIVVAGLLAPAPAAAQTVAVAYERAQEQEREALAASPPSVEVLRKVARAYEALVMRYPVSGYSDNALWQAAGLLERAFALSGRDRDRDGA